MKIRSTLSIDPYEIPLGDFQVCQLTEIKIPINLIRIITIKKILKKIK